MVLGDVSAPQTAVRAIWGARGFFYGKGGLISPGFPLPVLGIPSALLRSPLHNETLCKLPLRRPPPVTQTLTGSRARPAQAPSSRPASCNPLRGVTGPGFRHFAPLTASAPAPSHWSRYAAPAGARATPALRGKAAPGRTLGAPLLVLCSIRPSCQCPPVAHYKCETSSLIDAILWSRYSSLT